MKPINNILIISALLFFLNIELCSQTDNEFKIGTSKVINSHILQEKRKVWIYLPEGYDNSRTKYPLLYLLDGNTYFHTTTGLVDFLSFAGDIPKLIIVGIENVNQDTRYRDFTPTQAKGFHGEDIPTSGGADNFLRFLKKELVPFIEKNYRTEPFKIIVGTSMGGLFTSYALIKEPGVFNAYFAISPSLGWDNEYVNRLSEETFYKF